MTAVRVQSILRTLDDSGLDVWVDGGWGVDALVGRQTREHDDLDLGVARSDLEGAIRALGEVGYAVVDERYRDVTVRLADPDGNRIDLHPSTHRADGGSEQLDFDGVARYLPPPVIGRIGGRPVRCMSIEAQRDAHAGYAPRPQDHHDLAELARISGDAPTSAGDEP